MMIFSKFWVTGLLSGKKAGVPTVEMKGSEKVLILEQIKVLMISSRGKKEFLTYLQISYSDQMYCFEKGNEWKILILSSILL